MLCGGVGGEGVGGVEEGIGGVWLLRDGNGEMGMELGEGEVRLAGGGDSGRARECVGCGLNGGEELVMGLKGW